VPFVQRAHRRHDGDLAPVAPQVGGLGPHRGGLAEDLERQVHA
jgi:hypothetical protein